MTANFTLRRMTAGVQELPIVTLRETLIHEIQNDNYWHRCGGVIIGNGVYKFFEKRMGIPNPVIDYPDRTTVTPVVVLAETLSLDFTKKITHAQIITRARELGYEVFPYEFVINYGTTLFSWGEIGRNVKVMTEALRRGTKDTIAFSFSYNPRSIQEIVLKQHKFRANDLLLFIKIETAEQQLAGCTAKNA